jgi:TatD DNase family protein
MIDSHCHIAGPEFAGDLAAVVQRARDAGLERVFVILAADDEPELARAGEVSRLWPDVRFSIGVHPHAAGKFADDPARAARDVAACIDAQPRTRAIGEIGLDYHYDFAPREAQQQVFREQIRLARKRRLPIVIHTREAEDDTFAILAEEAAGDVGGVFHCFTGDRDMARRALDIGFHISLAGIVTFWSCIRWRRWCRSIACSSKPTARTSRRCRTAARATNRRGSFTWRNGSRSCAASTRRWRARRPRRISAACSTRNCNVRHGLAR